MIKIILKILSGLALSTTVISPVLYQQNLISLETNQLLMAIGMVLWFMTAANFIKR